MPATGVLIEYEDRVDLYTVDGEKLTSLAGFALPTFQRNHRLHPGPQVVAKAGNEYLLTGGSSELKAVAAGVLPLAYGYSLDGGFRLVRDGKVIDTFAKTDLTWVLSYKRDALSIQAGDQMNIWDLATGKKSVSSIGRCHLGDQKFFICDPYSGGPTDRDIKAGADELITVRTASDPHNLVPFPPGGGHWRHLSVSPDGKRLVLQHSGECEVPSIYVTDTDGGQPTQLEGGAEGFHLGWTESGLPFVHFVKPACGAGVNTPGVYVVDGSKKRLVIAVEGHADVAMWSRLPAG